MKQAAFPIENRRLKSQKCHNLNNPGTNESNAETKFSSTRCWLQIDNCPVKRPAALGLLPAETKAPVSLMGNEWSLSVMSNSVKTKFAGMLRGLLRRLDDNGEAAPEMSRTVTVTPSFQSNTPSAATSPETPPPAAARPTAARTTVARSAAPAPAAARSAAAPAVATAENSDALQLPLQSILAALPMDLRAKVIVSPPPGTMVSLPLEKILKQLAFGSVKISFDELREAIPGVFVNSGGEHDHKTVTLPLNEILTRLNPGRLSRRTEQKQFEVADEIVGPFGGSTSGVKISAGTKPTPSTTLTARTDTPPMRTLTPTPSAPVQPPPVAPPPPPFVPRTAAPGTSITPKPSSLSHDTSFAFKAAIPSNHGASATPPAPAPAQPPPVTPPPPPFVPRSVTPGTSITPKPYSLTPDTSLAANSATPHQNGAPKPATPISAPTPTPAPAPASPAPSIPTDQASIAAPLAALSEHWPEGLRLEIIQSNLGNAQVLLPVNLIEPALKRGRITFAWQTLRPWIKPTSPPASVHDNIELELPLSVIAPLFFTRQKTAARVQPSTTTPSDIPNLFFGVPPSRPATPQPPAAKKPEPQVVRPKPETPAIRPVPEPQAIRPKTEPQLIRPMPEPQTIHPLPEPRPIRPAPAPVDAKSTDSNYYAWGNDTDGIPADETAFKHIQKPATDFTSRRATPKEIVEQAISLPGVVGVLVALPDGLRVASQIPPEFNADTMAAFLPQIFDRVSQSTKELRMGALNNFNFTVGNVPWKIFRVNAVYFAAFGNAGEALPSAQLAALAAELDRKK
jgi:predicted regulator of Ras-like GTPase activity (Roadblock/LC7/MglB family)